MWPNFEVNGFEHDLFEPMDSRMHISGREEASTSVAVEGRRGRADVSFVFFGNYCTVGRL